MVFEILSELNKFVSLSSQLVLEQEVNMSSILQFIIPVNMLEKNRNISLPAIRTEIQETRQYIYKMLMNGPSRYLNYHFRTSLNQLTCRKSSNRLLSSLMPSILLYNLKKFINRKDVACLRCKESDYETKTKQNPYLHALKSSKDHFQKQMRILYTFYCENVHAQDHNNLFI